MLNSLLALALLLIPVPNSKSTEDWVTVRPEGTNVQFLMPAEPELVERTIEPEFGKQITIKMNVAQTDTKASFVFAFHDQAAPETVQKQRDILEWAAKNQIAKAFGVVEKTESFVVSKLPGRQIQYTFSKGDQDFRVVSRLLLDGGRLYQLNYTAPLESFDEEAARKFAESFQVVRDPAK